MRVSPEDAAPYFWDRRYAPAGDLPRGWAYYAAEGVCLAFHDVPWPRTVAVHVGVLREAWGRAVAPAKALISEMRDEYRPYRIIAWLHENNRAAIAFARRVGFAEDGRFPGVVMMGA